MQGLHVVWDWNGTLLDDLTVVVESLNVGIAKLGHAPIDEDGYRDHFTRPVRAFYDSLLGRPVSDMEWALLNKTFHDEYYTRARSASLTDDAVDALERVRGLGWTQSVLSMSGHSQLLEMVAAHGIGDYFARVDGLAEANGERKASHLESHLEALGHMGSEVVLVGDTPDDAVAARHVGAGVVLYDGGSHHLPTLHAMGAPVAHTLTEATDLAMGLARSERASGPG